MPDTTAREGADNATAGDPPIAPAGGELVIPVAALLFAIYYFFTILESPWTAQVGAFFIGTILIVLCLIFIVRTLVRFRRGMSQAGLSDLFSPEDLSTGRLAVFALTLLYVVLIPYGGFTITTFAFLWLGMAALSRGRKLVMISLVSLVITLGGYLLFIVAFNTRFPHGPFEALMDNVF